MSLEPEFSVVLCVPFVFLVTDIELQGALCVPCVLPMADRATNAFLCVSPVAGRTAGSSVCSLW